MNVTYKATDKNTVLVAPEAVSDKEKSFDLLFAMSKNNTEYERTI